MFFNAACIQLNCNNNIENNIEQAKKLINQALDKGADFIALPENSVFMSASPNESLNNSFTESNHPALDTFINIARQNNIFLLVGSLAIRENQQNKFYNRSFLINNNGEISARYDKIHLFDTSIKAGETHKESDRVIPGNKAVIANTTWGKVGLSICYDLRFPQLYRFLAQNGAAFITVPAAFTYYTGNAHWHVLLRARAIETGCYIIAPAQTGTHPSNRKTYGHSLIINPWGEIMADAGEEPGIIVQKIDINKVDEIRQQLPSLKHDREFLL